MLRTEIVHLLIAAPFQAVTLAVLPLSALAGAIRNLRAHFGDQVFLLHNRTRLDDGRRSDRRVDDRGAEHSVPAALGLAGAAGATVLAALAAAIVSFCDRVFEIWPDAFRSVISCASHWPRLRWRHCCGSSRRRATFAVLAAHIAAGAAVYFAALALLYAPTLVRILRPRPQHSEA